MPQDSSDNTWSDSGAIADLPTTGVSTTAAIEAKINQILAALRESEIISSS